MFEYSTLGKWFKTKRETIKNVGREQIDALKSLKPTNNKFIDNLFPSDILSEVIINKSNET